MFKNAFTIERKIFNSFLIIYTLIMLYMSYLTLKTTDINFINRIIVIFIIIYKLYRFFSYFNKSKGFKKYGFIKIVFSIFAIIIYYNNIFIHFNDISGGAMTMYLIILNIVWIYYRLQYFNGRSPLIIKLFVNKKYEKMIKNSSNIEDLINYSKKISIQKNIKENETQNNLLSNYNPHFSSSEGTKIYKYSKKEVSSNKKAYLKEYKKLLKQLRTRLQEIQEIDNDMTELLNIIIDEEKEKTDYRDRGSAYDISGAVSFLKTPHLRTGKLVQIDDPEEYLAYGTEFERGENRELLRNLMKSKIDNQIYGDLEVEISGDTDWRYSDRFYRDPRFAAMLFTADDLNNVEHYRENPMIAERDLKRINERIPNYTKYRAYKGFHSRMRDFDRSAAERRIDTLIEMRDTKNYDIIREQPMLVDIESRESLKIASNYKNKTISIYKEFEYIRDCLRKLGENV